jgi:hypothetical protein
VLQRTPVTTSSHTDMYKYILESVENLNWLAVVSLLLCFSIFVVSTIWIMTKKKDFIDKMSNMPLEDDE